MIIDSGKHIKCVFKNGTVIEGIVKEWASGSVELESLNDQSLMIIMHPEEDIMLIKVMPEVPAEEPAPAEESPLKEEIIAKLEEAQKEEDPELQNKSLEELRKMVLTQERKILVNKIKTHFPSGPQKSNYSSQMDVLPTGRRGMR